MPEVIPLGGELRFLGMILEAGASDMRLRLFKNDVTVDQGSSIGDFEEADFSGYEQAPLTWGEPYPAGFGYATADAEQVDFLHDGGPVSNVIYGYLIVDSVANKILYGDNFDPPALMEEEGDSVQVEPKLNLSDAWDV